jgi:2-dehydro-3-deoxyphosphogluconate aldolase/(4S)-4-hydroxy-2-oxoglutarate aldolase
MDQQTELAKLKKLGLIAVIRGPSVELTIQMVKALVEGGVLGIEITYSTPNAEEVVAELSRCFGNQIVLGMGTLTKPSQAQSAIKAGASFLVSPICEPLLANAMISTGVPAMVGALTPTEVFQAYEAGADVVKVFPGSMGGPSYLKALKGPFPYIPLMPTGGVSESNVKEWFSAGAFSVGAGSELCPPQLAKEGKFSEITGRAAAFVKAVNEAKASVERPLEKP